MADFGSKWEDVCWICLQSSTESTQSTPLVYPCACPRPVHESCLARWQLHCAGREEELCCRFCKQVLPHWRQAFKPRSAQVAPLMSIQFHGRTYWLQVHTGQGGVEQFKADVKRLLDLQGDDEFDITFECQVPGEGGKLELHGLEAFDAAVYCASLTAAERLATAGGDAGGQPASAVGTGSTNTSSSTQNSGSRHSGASSSHVGGTPAGQDRSDHHHKDEPTDSTAGSAVLASSNNMDSSTTRVRPNSHDGSGSSSSGCSRASSSSGSGLSSTHSLTTSSSVSSSADLQCLEPRSSLEHYHHHNDHHYGHIHVPPPHSLLQRTPSDAASSYHSLAFEEDEEQEEQEDRLGVTSTTGDLATSRGTAAAGVQAVRSPVKTMWVAACSAAWSWATGRVVVASGTAAAAGAAGEHRALSS